MSPPLPQYLTSGQDQATILARMLARITDKDVAQGGFLWDALAPSAIEMALAAAWCQEVLRRAFTQTTDTGYLDLKADEIGLTRLAATAATGPSVTFTGTNGTVIPSGTVVSTAGTTGVTSQSFATTASATIASGSASAAVAALTPGAAGNVAAGKIVLLAHAINGVTGVTNPSPTTGGTDVETDAALLVRILAVKQNPSTGGNKADYDRWATSVAGVGGVATVPVRDGAGTVSLAVVDATKLPATQALVDSVQAYIAPPWKKVLQAAVSPWTIAGAGVTTDATAPGTTGAAFGTVVKMAPNAAQGQLLLSTLGANLPAPTNPAGAAKPGVWRMRVRCKVDTATGASACLVLGVFNNTAGNWCAISPSGGLGTATTSYTGAQLPIAYASATSSWLTQLFYWNGTDNIQGQVLRTTPDGARTVWVDEVQFDSTFSQDNGSGVAPVGHRVTVEAASAVTINVAATLTIGAGYDVTTVRNNVSAAVTAYLASIAYNPPGTTVFYAKVGAAVVNVAGVVSYASLLVNGAGADVAVGAQAVPVPGTYTWS